MSLDEIFKYGDRVEFKQYIRRCTDKELASVWMRAGRTPVQDFAELAYDELVRRGVYRPL